MITSKGTKVNEEIYIFVDFLISFITQEQRVWMALNKSGWDWMDKNGAEWVYLLNWGNHILRHTVDPHLSVPWKWLSYWIEVYFLLEYCILTELYHPNKSLMNTFTIAWDHWGSGSIVHNVHLTGYIHEFQL